MSKEALFAVEEARKELLESQVVCAWCNNSFASNDDLLDHIQFYNLVMPERK